jgi:hypothetical protein
VAAVRTLMIGTLAMAAALLLALLVAVEFELVAVALIPVRVASADHRLVLAAGTLALPVHGDPRLRLLFPGRRHLPPLRTSAASVRWKHPGDPPSPPPPPPPAPAVPVPSDVAARIARPVLDRRQLNHRDWRRRRRREPVGARGPYDEEAFVGARAEERERRRDEAVRRHEACGRGGLRGAGLGGREEQAEDGAVDELACAIVAGHKGKGRMVGGSEESVSGVWWGRRTGELLLLCFPFSFEKSRCQLQEHLYQHAEQPF